MMRSGVKLVAWNAQELFHTGEDHCIPYAKIMQPYVASISSGAVNFGFRHDWFLFSTPMRALFLIM